MAAAEELRTCDYCGASLGVSARPDRRFCSTSCKNSWNYNHRAEQAKGRICPRCGEQRPIEDFHSSTGSGARTTYCRDCEKVRARERWERERAQGGQPRVRTCAVCLTEYTGRGASRTCSDACYQLLAAQRVADRHANRRSYHSEGPELHEDRPRTWQQCLGQPMLCDCGAEYRRGDFWAKGTLTCPCGRRISYRCPWVSCEHHLGLLVSHTTGTITTPRPSRDVALDHADFCLLEVIDQHGPQTLEAVGEIQGVTRERIRQVEARALGKLRKVAKHRGLSLELLLGPATSPTRQEFAQDIQARPADDWVAGPAPVRHVEAPAIQPRVAKVLPLPPSLEGHRDRLERPKVRAVYSPVPLRPPQTARTSRGTDTPPAPLPAPDGGISSKSEGAAEEENHDMAQRTLDEGLARLRELDDKIADLEAARAQVVGELRGDDGVQRLLEALGVQLPGQAPAPPPAPKVESVQQEPKKTETTRRKRTKEPSPESYPGQLLAALREGGRMTPKALSDATGIPYGKVGCSLSKLGTLVTRVERGVWEAAGADAA